MGRAEIWAIRAGQAVAAVVFVLLLSTPWRMSWPAQLVLAAAAYLQLRLIGRLTVSRAARDHAWLQGYFAALDDASCPDHDEPS